MKLLRLWPVLVGVLIVVLAMLFLPVFGKPLVSLVTSERVVASVDVLEEMRELFRFNTVQYVYKVVFPYDFFRQGITLSTINQKWRAGNPGLRWPNSLQVILDNPSEALDDDDLLFIKTWQLCSKAGLKFQEPDYQFLVATIVVEAGFDLQGSVFANPQSASAESVEKAFRTEIIAPGEQGREGGRRAVITLPPAAITDVRIEDSDYSDQRRAAEGDAAAARAMYPDIELKPSQWKTIATFVMEHYEQKTVREGILADARRNASVFMKEFLLQAGWDDVVLVE